MDIVQKVLNVSNKLYEYLGEIPLDENRDEFLSRLDELLEERQQVLTLLCNEDSEMLQNHELKDVIIEVDRAIVERMRNIQATIKKDFMDVQNLKKSESSYSNPYAATQTIDGMFYDKKK